MKIFDDIRYFIYQINISALHVYIEKDNNVEPFFSYPEGNVIDYNKALTSFETKIEENYDEEKFILFTSSVFNQKNPKLRLLFDAIISKYFYLQNTINKFLNKISEIAYKSHYQDFYYLIYQMKDCINSFIKYDFLILNLKTASSSTEYIFDKATTTISVEDFNLENDLFEYDLSLDKVKDVELSLKIYFKTQSVLAEYYFTKQYYLDLLEKELSKLMMNFIFTKEKELYINKLESIINKNKKELETKNVKLLSQLNVITVLEKSRDSLFSNIYHQLLTPLNSILGFTLYLQSFHKDDFNPSTLEDIISIESNALYLLYNILNIIEYTKMTSGTLTYNNELFLVKDSLNNINKVSRLFSNISNTNISITYPEKNLNIFFDYKKIEQILYSLMFFLSSYDIPQINLSIDDDSSKVYFIFTILKSNLPKTPFNELNKIINNPYKETKFDNINLFFLSLAVKIILDSGNKINIDNSFDSINIKISIRKDNQK